MARKAKLQEWPREIRRGSFVAKLYRRTKTVAGKEYESFRLSYFEGTARKLREFGDVADAEKAADEAARALGTGRLDALAFSPLERGEYQACVNELQGTGKPLLDAVREYVRAMQQLPNGVPLLDAVTDYAKRHPSHAAHVTTQAAVEALLEDRERAGRSEIHKAKLESVLTRFAAAFSGPLASVQPPLVLQWLDGLRGTKGGRLSSRTRHNHFGCVVTLAKFALSRRWLSREIVDEIAALPVPKGRPVGDPEVFTPGEMAKLLAAAPDDIRATLAIGGFAGLRTEEVHRLAWADVKLSERVIIVAAAKAKTSSRRVVPISDNLAAWLAPLAKESGQVDPSPTSKATTHRWRRIGEKVGIKWRHNALRHSYITYRLATTGDPARTAFEAGNSATMVHRHYKALKTEADGKGWFETLP